ncbi:TROVE domain-containing protein [Antrihabitans sp. YC3-6]|uniref:TROVE domain-containing protein n=1 Tax=Antrihabitans stalagmiti TaxID=2799499 RepID=A0A934NR07_9NOCA|nr:TROVE domain-containing protein [Antrihabitans stalagmiti]MBJ8339747.1 TROVE domain-containing protein [Antrihabitans stalagmiti]
MSKFNVKGLRSKVVRSMIRSEPTPSTLTSEGAPGYLRDAKSELFLLAVTNMVGESTFYEAGAERDSRYVALVRELAVSDPEWTARLIAWLRNGAQLRSAALVAAAEFVAGRLQAGLHGGNREVVAAVLQRADEPGELLGYWLGTHGRSVPKPVKRGIGDGVRRLYTERALLKWDSAARDIRFGDVIELTHPAPTTDRQGDLFAYAIGRRHGRGELPASLSVLQARQSVAVLPNHAAVLQNPELLAASGMTWEALSSSVGPMDAQAWEAIIPSMGYMALLRNLRNFDDAGVADSVAAHVAARLADPDEVARSRQLPMRYLAAYRAAPSLRWAHALETALGHSLSRVPVLPGRTLVLVDRSGSMFWSPLSQRSTVTRADGAAVFGAALAVRAERADLVEFGSTSSRVDFRRGESVLRIVDRFGDLGGTATAHALRKHYRGHDRVVLVTDEQAWEDRAGQVNDAVPHTVPMYTWNVAGCRAGHAPSGAANRHTFGGLTDAGFELIELIERGRNGNWPF